MEYVDPERFIGEDLHRKYKKANKALNDLVDLLIIEEIYMKKIIKMKEIG